MYPVLIDISDSIKIYAFGTFIVLAFLAASFYVRRRAARDLGLDKAVVFNVCFALLFIGLAGARLLYAMIKYDEFASEKMKLFYIWQGGLVWYGGLIVCLLWLACSATRSRQHFTAIYKPPRSPFPQPASSINTRRIAHVF